MMSWLSLAWKAAPWAIAALAIGFGLYERSGYYEEAAARAADLAAAQAAVEKAQAADAAHTTAIEDAHAAEIARLKDQANAREVSIAAAPPTVGCAASPAMRALFDGLRARTAAAGADRPGNPGGAGAAVPR